MDAAQANIEIVKPWLDAHNPGDWDAVSVARQLGVAEPQRDSNG